MDTDPLSNAKARSALAAASRVNSGDVIGIGSGSTVEQLIQHLKKRLEDKTLSTITCIPASYQSEYALRAARIPIASLIEYPELDLTIDGADEIDPVLNLIKGGGAALTREKILATASKRFIVISDYTKISPLLGTKHPIPVEVLPFGLGFVQKSLGKLGGTPQLRAAKYKNGPVITDNGNMILDVKFPPIQDPGMLAESLNRIPGLIEHGLFCNLTEEAIIGHPDRVETIRPSKARK